MLLTFIKKTIKSSFWLLIPKFYKLAIVFFLDILIANHIGSELFGLYSFIISILVIFIVFPKFGLDELLLKEAINLSFKNIDLLSICLLRVGLATIACILFVSILFYELKHEQALIYSLILAPTLFTVSFSSIEIKIQASENFKLISILQVTALTLSSFIKAYVIICDAPFYWLFIAVYIELCFTSIISLGYLLKNLRIFKKNFALKNITIYFKKGLPLVLASISIILYMRLDQVMLKNLKGLHEVGIYAVSIRISESFFALASIICIATFPYIVKIKNDPEKYNASFIYLFRVFGLIGLFTACLIYFINHDLILLLFNEEYIESGPVLFILCLGLIFSYVGIISFRWLIIENKQEHILYRTLVGLTANVILNYLLIPPMGAKGAAIATVISLFITNFIYTFTQKDLKPLAKLKLSTFRTYKKGEL